MSAAALAVVRALADDEFAQAEDEETEFLTGASDQVRRDVARVDGVLRFELEEDADDEDEPPDDDEIVVRLHQRRLRYWIDRLTPEESAGALAYRLELLGQAVTEFVGLTAMMVERHPELEGPVNATLTRLRDELERVFERLDGSGR